MHQKSLKLVAFFATWDACNDVKRTEKEINLATHKKWVESVEVDKSLSTSSSDLILILTKIFGCPTIYLQKQIPAWPNFIFNLPIFSRSLFFLRSVLIADSAKISNLKNGPRNQLMGSRSQQWIIITVSPFPCRPKLFISFHWNEKPVHSFQIASPSNFMSRDERVCQFGE